MIFHVLRVFFSWERLDRTAFHFFPNSQSLNIFLPYIKSYCYSYREIFWKKRGNSIRKEENRLLCLLRLLERFLSLNRSLRLFTCISLESKSMWGYWLSARQWDNSKIEKWVFADSSRNSPKYSVYIGPIPRRKKSLFSSCMHSE